MTPCSNPCGCPREAIKRVWFAGCAVGCTGHRVCDRHGSGKYLGITRAVALEDAP